MRWGTKAGVVTLVVALFVAAANATADPVYDPQPAAPDRAPPETRIDRSALRISTRTARFWFSASEAAQGYLCQLDKGDFKPCGPPRTYKRLKPGKHAFRVKAVDLAGNVGSPAVARFKIPRPKRHR
jgi:hypothetical protein